MDKDGDDQSEAEMNLHNEVYILTEFAQLEDQQRRHLVKIYQPGKIE
jgi:tRNA pseudouridine-54 N-methylase